MEPSQQLLDELEREDLEQARRASPSQKLRAGGDLFDNACRWMLAGIRRDFPGISQLDAMTELRRRLDISQALEDRL